MKVLRTIRHFFSQHPFCANAISATLITFFILTLVMIACGYAPFGVHSLAVADARIQYLDFFSFFKNVLSGTNSIIYSFSKGLGGASLALYAYYLASPLNFLCVFFQHADLNIFFNLLFVIKAALASACFAIFLTYKFRSHLQESNWKVIFIIILSCCYGLSEYMLSQASNIMWLDGVFMLPLLMLATSRIIDGQSSYPLAILVGITILFNWYSAGIDCIFIIAWFIFELVMHHISQENAKIVNRQYIIKSCRFIATLALGVLMSAILFLPTILALFGTSHGTPSFTSIFNFAFIGQIPSIIESYTLGAGSTYGAVSLYCGSLALIGVIMLLLSKKLSKPLKVAFISFLAFIVLIFYWQPFVMLFSLFEQVGSYWYRYSYVAIAVILFMSAHYFIVLSQKSDYRKAIKVGLATALVIILIQYLRSTIDLNLAYRTAFFIVIIALSLSYLLQNKSTRQRTICLLIVAGLSVCEIAYETYLFLRGYQEVDTAEYASYTSATQETINNIFQSDSGLFRISATSTRYTDEAGIPGATANYNEPLAFNYMSIPTYTSTPDEQQLSLLNNLGYRTDFDIRTIVNTSILGSDSLLGVKYILSEYPINGLKLRSDLTPTSASRQVYENPYTLPLAITYRDDLLIIDSDNPFEYQNQFYGKLLGHEVTLYHKLDYRLSYTATDQEYIITIPEGNYAAYGNIPATGDNHNLILTVGDADGIAYARSAETSSATLTPSVFYIPSDGTKQVSTITLTGAEEYLVGSAEFYLLDLDLLATVTSELSSRSPANIEIAKDSLTIDINAELGESLYLSVPADSGWTITRNGVTIQPDLFAGTLISIPLEDGANHIELQYHVAGLQSGIVISILGIGGTIILAYSEIKRKIVL